MSGGNNDHPSGLIARLNDSSTYFDMDCFKKRTVRVENGDGLLVLEKNGNHAINNRDLKTQESEA